MPDLKEMKDHPRPPPTAGTSNPLLNGEPPPRNFLKSLGPGLITGASDDDPSGIATYSQAGAQFGYSMLWTMILIFPLMAGIQQISALIGRVTGAGIAGNMRKYYSAWTLYPVVGLLLVANTINLAADINAMGAALKLLIGGPAQVYAAILAVISVVLQVRMSYVRYSGILKWLTLSLFAYVATVFAVHLDWWATLRGSFIPNFSTDGKFLVMLIALLGTTISPYLFFWQSSAEVEEVTNNADEQPLKKAPEQAEAQKRRIAWDTYLGMAVSNVIAFFIMVTVAGTLHAGGVTEIESAAQAAEALRPVAGPLAFFLFAVGIVGTGMLALPVLAGSAAYAVGEAMRWPTGLERKAREAKGFYGVIAVATLAAVIINFTPLDPIKALFWTSVINGVIAVPLMVVMMFMATNPKVMGRFTLSPGLRLIGWLASALMLAASLGLLFAGGG
ncbi:MAG: natural resistance-associated macrophage protein [Verrucomicrobiaceae bacterium]|nr:natural resistance-associated macrophage protein [Verrucomicrobiaceae bacterium]